MKATINDIMREQLFFKKVNLYQGKYLTAYTNHKNNYVISYNNNPIVIVREDQINLLCLNDKDKNLITLQNIIRNQLRGLNLRTTYNMALTDY